MVRCALLALLLAGCAAPADFAGRWRAALHAGGRSGEVEFELHRSGDTLTGTVWLSGEPRAIAPSQIEGNRATLILLIPRDGRLARVPSAVRLEGDRLFFENGPGAGSARRVRPAPPARAERLDGLIRLWGAVKFFHPWLAHKPVDWDAALMAAIPRAEAAATREAYAAALSAMLAALGDPETRLLPDAAPAPPAPPGPARGILRYGYHPRRPASHSFFYWDWETRQGRAAAPYLAVLPWDLRAAVRTTEPPHHAPDLPAAEIERPYPGELPGRLHRLLALARLWNTARYFFPYHDLADRPWDALLPEFIPVFEAARDRRAYLFAIARLGAQLRDGHVRVSGFPEALGMAPPVSIRPVEGRAVVTHSAAPGVAPGDIVLAVDGEEAAPRARRLEDLLPHATPQAAALAAHESLLAGTQPRARLRLLKADGREVETLLPRTGPPLLTPREGPAFRALPGGAGYIDLTRLTEPDAGRALDALSAAPALVLDLRGYPTPAWAAVAARLTPRRVPRAMVEVVEWHGPDPAASVRTRYLQHGWTGLRPPYRGRVAVLIDATAMSAAEHACLYFATAARATFIGAPTAGTNGDVTNTVLPGEVLFAFTGLSVRHADGRQLQRIGIQPHVLAEPTLAGIRAGRDEILERAVAWLAARP